MILVTGSAGFIGANFVLDWFKNNDESIVSLDKLTYAGNMESLSSLEGDSRHIFVHGDICDIDLLDKILSKYRPRYIVNFAAESHVDRSIHGPEDFIMTNIMGTFHLLQATRVYMQTLSAKERKEFRFLHVSTDEVYGTLDAEEPAFNEENSYEPNSPYSASKASSDHLVRAYFHTYNVPVLTTNCSNNYGPLQFPEKLVPLVICNAISGKKLPIYGDGKQIRDWLYVQDHCSAIRSVLKNGRIGETYNVGGWNEKTNVDVVYKICDLLDRLKPRSDGKSYRDQIEFVTDRPGHDRRYAIDANKIKSELNWEPLETFETGIQKTIQWYLDNQEWVSNVQSGSYQQWLKKNYTNLF